MSFYVPSVTTAGVPMGAASILQAVNAIERVIDAAILALRVAESRRNTRAQLARLSTRQLIDIGIDRDDIDLAVERRIR
jgi:uncharacterized protein YjiS (DUF1127 family)